MDNYYGNAPQRPRKRVTKKMLRYRQFGGIAVIGLVVLLIIILVANACSKDGGKAKPDDTQTTTTAATTTTMPPITTTVPTTTTSPFNSQVKLSTRALFVDVGETDVALITAYPEGCGEANEVWTSMDPTIAKVDDLGYVTGMKPGETYIILSFDNKPDVKIEIKVTVADNGSVQPSVTTSTAGFGIGYPTGNAAAVSFTTSVDVLYGEDANA